MKTPKNKIILSATALAGGLTMLTGCNGLVVVEHRQYQPPVYEPAPVVVAEPVLIPQEYVEVDGVYYGVVGINRVYLVNNVWIICEPWRVQRFHVWERDHIDWRRSLAVRNELYRKDIHGHEMRTDGHFIDKHGSEVTKYGRPAPKNYDPSRPVTHTQSGSGQTGSHSPGSVPNTPPNQNPNGTGQNPNGGNGHVQPGQGNPQPKPQPQQQQQQPKKKTDDKKKDDKAS